MAEKQFNPIPLKVFKEYLMESIRYLEKAEKGEAALLQHIHDSETDGFLCGDPREAIGKQLDSVQIAIAAALHYLHRAYPLVDHTVTVQLGAPFLSEDRRSGDPNIADLTEDGRLLCKFGYPPSVQFCRQHDSVQDMTCYYAHDLACAMSELDTDRRQRLSVTPILLQYYHVYPSSKRTAWLLDNDNYDYKHLTDMVVESLGRGDHALSCSFMYDTLVTDEIQGATYCIVSPQTSGIMLPDDFVDAVKRSHIRAYKPLDFS